MWGLSDPHVVPKHQPNRAVCGEDHEMDGEFEKPAQTDSPVMKPCSTGTRHETNDLPLPAMSFNPEGNGLDIAAAGEFGLGKVNPNSATRTVPSLSHRQTIPDEEGPKRQERLLVANSSIEHSPEFESWEIDIDEAPSYDVVSSLLGLWTTLSEKRVHVEE